jgi:hypothetical protein
MFFEPEDIDLAALGGELRRLFGNDPPRGYLPGRTALRDATARLLGCSDLQAEEIVDTMVARGFLRYEGASAEEVDDLGPWSVQAEA